MNVTNQRASQVRQTVPLLAVSDIERSCRFYCEGLGFEITQRWEPEGELAWCWLKHGGAALMLERPCDQDAPAGERGKGVTFYFLCEDAAAVFQEITSHGIKATKPAVTFYEMNQTFVTDPDGYLLCFENPTSGG